MERTSRVHMMIQQLAPCQKRLVADRMITLVAEGMREAETVMQTALQWTQETIQAVREAPDNPYGPEDEVLAQAILDKLTALRRQSA